MPSGLFLLVIQIPRKISLQKSESNDESLHFSYGPGSRNRGNSARPCRIDSERSLKHVCVVDMFGTFWESSLGDGTALCWRWVIIASCNGLGAIRQQAIAWRMVSFVDTRLHGHWTPRVVMLPTLSSLEVVIMTTSGVTSDNKVRVMGAFGFRGINW